MLDHIKSLTTTQILEARDWIADCEWGDLDDPTTIADLSDTEVIQGIKRHYAGGIPQFIQDGE